MGHVVERPKVQCPCCGMWRWLPSNTGPSWLDGPVWAAVGYVTCAGRKGFPLKVYNAAEQLATLPDDSPSRFAIVRILRRVRDRLRDALRYIDDLLDERNEEESWRASASGRMVVGGESAWRAQGRGRLL